MYLSALYRLSCLTLTTILPRRPSSSTSDWRKPRCRQARYLPEAKQRVGSRAGTPGQVTGPHQWASGLSGMNTTGAAPALSGGASGRRDLWLRPAPGPSGPSPSADAPRLRPQRLFPKRRSPRRRRRKVKPPSRPRAPVPPRQTRRQAAAGAVIWPATTLAAPRQF